MTRILRGAVFSAWLVVASTADFAAESPASDPYWFLIHDRAVQAELKLSEAQKQALRNVTDELDGRFMVLRGQTTEQAAEKFKELTAQTQTRLKTVLKAEQHRRLAEITMRVQGTQSLLREDVAAKMAYTAEQRKHIEEIIGESKMALAQVEKQGQPTEAAEKERTRLRTDEQTRLFEALTKSQQAKWRELVGANFDTATLGKGAFKAPELALSKDWLNSRPLQLAQLRGRVVVVHFYACGCINCIHNYPSYRNWQDQFAGQAVTMIGIHTPETTGERVVETVRKKAQDEKLTFPIVIDNDKANWTAWGNTMWPTVYLIDKQGYVRYWWMGELNWQGAEGEKIMGKRIEELLGEKPEG